MSSSTINSLSKLDSKLAVNSLYSESKSLEYKRYTNIIRFIESRKSIPKNVIQNETDFIQKSRIKKIIVIKIDGEDKDMKKDKDDKDMKKNKEGFVFMILKDKELKSQEFQKIVMKYIKNKPNVEIIIVGPTDMPLFLRKMTNYKFLYVENQKVSCVPYENVIVSKHEILTEEEIRREEEFQGKNRIYFPKLLMDDTMVLWIGAEPGDVVKITSPSESSLLRIVYRYVVARKASSPIGSTISEESEEADVE